MTAVADLPYKMRKRITISESGCWEWQGVRNNGYGRFRVGPAMQYAHRVSYLWLVGPIPDGLQIDHLCRNRACCNPAHLEPVTAKENTRRWARTITHCPSGHPLSGSNLIVGTRRRDGSRYRQCRQCKSEWNARRSTGRAA